MKKLLILPLFLVGCIDQGLELNRLWANDERVSVYVNSFFYEAQIRGLVVPRENLIITVVNNPNGKPNPFEPGLHTELRTGQRVILLDEYVFSTNTYQENEVMIFHELGHWRGLEHCDPCSDTLIMNSHVNFYMWVKHPERREPVLDQFFSLMK